jgi:hypothetical protein
MTNKAEIWFNLQLIDKLEPLLLVGEGINSKFDKKTVKRLQDMEKPEAKDKEHVFAMLDAFLAKNKLQAILA